jgi:hypothetical protein
MKIVIGLTGFKQSGKSTSASIIKELYPKAKEVALADKLKDVCSVVFNVPRDHFDNQDFKEQLFIEPKELTLAYVKYILNKFNIINPNLSKLNCVGKVLVTPRQIAQIVGTEVLRRCANEDIHCENIKLLSKITIVSDMRFPNEYNYFAKNSDIYFIPLYIDRKLAEDKVDRIKSHSSETSIYLFRDNCLKIDNNGSIEGLKTNIKNVLNKMMEK